MTRRYVIVAALALVAGWTLRWASETTRGASYFVCVPGRQCFSPAQFEDVDGCERYRAWTDLSCMPARDGASICRKVDSRVTTFCR